MQFSDVDASGKPKEMIAYLDDVTRYIADAKRASLAALDLKPGDAVLDVGCGVGDDVRALCEIVGANGYVAGVDSSQAMIEEARKRGAPPNAAFEQAAATALPFDDGRFNAVRADRVFQHLPDPVGAAREMCRVLKPGGRTMLIDPDWGMLGIAGSDRETTQRIIDAMNSHTADGWAGRHHLATLKRAGFANVTATPVAYPLPFPFAAAAVLNNAISHATKAGNVSHAQAARWLADLQMADERGEFMCVLTLFIAMGQRSA
jgi:SAM-dependent methyltransferase